MEIAGQKIRLFWIPEQREQENHQNARYQKKSGAPL